MANRTLQLKLVKFRAGNRKNFQPPAMDALCRQLWQVASSVGQRHVPDPNGTPGLSVGDSCFYVNRISSRNPRDGIMMQCVSYTHGLVPETTITDFTLGSLPITAAPFLDSTSQTPRQIVHSYRVVWLAHAAIVEIDRGAGGTTLLEQALHKMLKRHVDPNLPSFQLVDVTGGVLLKQIALGGGVRKVIAKVSVGTNDQTQPVAYRLSQLKSLFGSRASVSCEVDLGDDIPGTQAQSTQRAVDVLDEYGSGGALDGAALVLRDGSRVDGLGRFREKRVVQIGTTSGRLNNNEVETALWNYADELRVPDSTGWRLLNTDGSPSGVTP